MPVTNSSAIATSQIWYAPLTVPFTPITGLKTVNMSQSHIRYLLSTGKTEWEGMERYVGGM